MIFINPSSTKGRVTGKSIINIYNYHDFLGIWEDIREKIGEEKCFLLLTMLRLTCLLQDSSEGRELLIWKFLPIDQISIQFQRFGLRWKISLVRTIVSYIL